MMIITLNGRPAPPSATTPQTFCDGAMVANLQTKNGVNVVWYASPTGGEALPPATPLLHGTIYYAAQTNATGCESERTAVMVIIDNSVFIDAPNVPYEVELCSTATLADVPTDGNTNIVWFDRMTGGNELPLTTVLNNGDTYYAAIKYGNGTCFSAHRAEVNIIIVDEISTPNDIESPQYFCEGAVVGNLATPNNQIVWYSANGDLLKPTDKLTQGTYYAAQKAGSCESVGRVAVYVHLDGYLPPIAPPIQTTCGNVLYISELTITGAGIKWYDDNNVEITSPSTTVAQAGKTYYATQTAGNCESEPTAVYIESRCFSPMGTVFPFVHTGDENFDKQFVTTAKLYAMPPEKTLDKIGYIRKQIAIRETSVTYYDCSVDEPIIGAPKNPGTMGYFNNPGLPINWNAIGVANSGDPDKETLTAADNCPTVPIGKYIFKDIAPGEYVIAISRPGFLTRYGVINVTGDDYLKHRELLGGDVNGDMKIDEKDYSAIRSKESMYGSAIYNVIYDVTGDKGINTHDFNIIRVNFGAHNTIYQETEKWVNP